MPDQTRLTITQDMGIRALKHLDDGTFPAPDAPREDHLAVQYLLRKEGERLRAEKAELLRRKRDADASSARRAAISFTSSTEVNQGGRRHRARVPNMTDADRARVTRNLDLSFITEDENGIPVPKTANAAIMSVETYLRLTQPPEGDPHALLHKQQIMSMKAIEEALATGAPNNRAREEREHQTREPATSGAPAMQPLRQAQPGEDLRNVITQRTMDRNRSQRSADAMNLDDPADRNFEPCGAACFSFNIRDTRMPKGFKLTAGTPKYDGKQDPRLWLEDYLIACTCQGGTSTMAMQYIQLMLTDSARGWLTSQPRTPSKPGKNFKIPS